MNPANLGLFLGAGGYRGHLIFHLLDAAGELVVLVEKFTKMAVAYLQIVDTIFQFGELVDEVVMFYRHKTSLKGIN